MENQIYILELEGHKYYVGKSSNAVERFEQHRRGTGSEWTKKHKPVKLLEIRPMTSEHDENNITKDLMKKYGINNVRGGSYCQVNLTDISKKALEIEVLGNSDACFKCGQHGHFSNKCPTDEENHGVYICGDCDIEFKTKRGFDSHKCYTNKRSYRPQYSPKNGACYRCGRTSHYADNCYATTHVRGYELDD